MTDTPKVSWAKEQRLLFLADMLRVYGSIGRIHLMRKFRISNAQAALDFKLFKQQHPDTMRYDKHKRIYVANLKSIALAK